MDMALFWSDVAQAALNYIVVSTISNSNQKQTGLDLKTDLRTTKEDLLAELKTTQEQLMNQIKDSNKN